MIRYNITYTCPQVSNEKWLLDAGTVRAQPREAPPAAAAAGGDDGPDDDD
jgi:hypothetical protein